MFWEILAVSAILFSYLAEYLYINESIIKPLKEECVKIQNKNKECNERYFKLSEIHNSNVSYFKSICLEKTKEINNLKESITELNKLRYDYNLLKNESRTELGKLRYDYNLLKNEIKGYINENNQLIKSNKANQETKMENKKLIEDIRKKNIDLESMKINHSKTNTEMEALKSDISLMGEKFENLSKEHEMTNEKLIVLNKENNNLKESQIELNKIKADCEKLKNEKALITKNNKTNEDLRKENLKLSEEIKKKNVDLESMKINQSKTNTEMETLKLDISLMGEKVQNLSKKEEINKEKVINLNKENEKIKTENNTLKKEIEKINDSNKIFQNNVLEINADKIKLEKELDKIKNENKKIKNDFEKTEKLNKMINEKTKDNTRLQKEFYELQKKSVELAVDLKIKSSDEMYYRNALKNHNDEIKKLKENHFIKYDKLRTELLDIKQKYEETTAEHISAVSKLSSLSIDNRRLEEEKKKIEIKLQEKEALIHVEEQG